ncbi:hypothetical protein BKA62DRAFT_707754 [Auriculariales sp. MPI-PUGE-AT-0066]|nr:hypothetical protein BKA62DRAFT_707754 [Auriculariales sp. MPI-PUGE-AT-0066]
MSTRASGHKRWSSVLPVLVAAHKEQPEERHSGTFGGRQNDWWHAFETSRQRHRTAYEDAELARTEAQRVRDEKFREFMRALHIDFLKEEERRVKDYEAQEQLIDDDFQKDEETRERDFTVAEQRREDHFREVFQAGLQSERWHAELRRTLYAEREAEVESEMLSLEQMMTKKFDTLRASLLQRLDRLNEQQLSSHDKAIRPAERDLRSHLRDSHTISPVMITSALPDEDAGPEPFNDRARPLSLQPPPIDTRLAPPMAGAVIPFPALEPISPVMVSPRPTQSPTERRNSGGRSQTRSPSFGTGVPEDEDEAFPPETTGPTQRDQLRQMLTMQDHQYSEDEACFEKHFKEAESRRNATEAERNDFFEAALGERKSWFRELEIHRTTRSADAEYNRSHAEMTRTETFKRHQANRLTRITMSQARAEREHEAEKAGHIVKVVNKQRRLIRLAEVQNAVITQLRLRLRDLQNGNQAILTPHHGRVRPRGPTGPPPKATPPRLPLPVPMPAPAPTGGPAPEQSRLSLDRVERDRSGESQQWNRQAHAKFRASYYQPDAVEFVPGSLFFRLPALHNALPILLPSRANVMMSTNELSAVILPIGLAERTPMEERVSTWQRLLGRQKGKTMSATELIDLSANEFQAAQRRREYEFKATEKARQVAFDRAEQRRAVEFAQASTRRADEAAMATAERAYKFDDGQQARVAASRVAEERRRAAAIEWAARREHMVAEELVRADQQWKQHTTAVHADFVTASGLLSEELGEWQRDVMMEYEMDLPFAIPPALQ